MDRVDDPRPAASSVLREFSPFVSTSYQPVCTPNPTGESIAELYDRTAYVLADVIRQLDQDPRCPATVLICTHAATFVAAARVLTGKIPDDPAIDDFVPWTSCLTSFERRSGTSANPPDPSHASCPSTSSEWSVKERVLGGWDCVDEGDCSFLRAGAERGW